MIVSSPMAVCRRVRGLGGGGVEGETERGETEGERRKEETTNLAESNASTALSVALDATMTKNGCRARLGYFTVTAGVP
jgi:hypothetical protein